MEKNEDERRCLTCGRKLQEGDNLWRIQEGVLGILNFVPLDRALEFCTNRCLKDFCREPQKGSQKLPERIP